MMPINQNLILAAILGSMAIPASAALTYPGCADMQGTDFTVTSLIANSADTTIKEPTKMALTTNDQGNVDVYFVQRFGKVRKYDGTAKTLSLVGNFNFAATASTNVADTNAILFPPGGGTSSSEGLQGIALDPNFKTNHWVYLYFVMKSLWKVDRYTITGGTLDMASVKPILRFTHPTFAQHAGSGLRFDAEGNLWVTVADDGGSNWPADQTVPYQAANTNKYFGKILRIKPRPIADNQPAAAAALGVTYDIPAGNLRQKFFDIGGPAGQDTTKILPEIYIMGNRNPYSITIDTVRKAVSWGEVGPDTYTSPTGSTQWTEEFNFTTQPGNFGWPMWAGVAPMPTAGWAGYTAQPPPTGGFGPMSAPVNSRSDNTGVTNLSPAITPIIYYPKACAITGPVYYYNGALNSSVKFPPHLNGAWFIADFNSPWINAVELNPAGTGVLSMRKMFSVSAGGSPTLQGATATGNSLKQIPSAIMNASNAILDFQMGSDGSMYIMNYSGYRTTDAKTGLVRITYNGTCSPTTTDLASSRIIRDARVLLRVQGQDVSVLSSGKHQVEVRGLTGKILARREGKDQAHYVFNELNQSGVYLVYLNSPEGQRVTKIIRQ